MRQAEKERKKIQSQIPFILDPSKKIAIKKEKENQKIKNPLSSIIFSQNGDRQAEKQKKKKKLVPNSVHTRPREENSEKKQQKNKIPLSDIIFSQNGMRQAEKERKKFQSQIPFILDPSQKIVKKIEKKNQKNQKTSIQHFFQPKQDEIGRERQKKKNWSRIQFILGPSKKIPKKITKKFKKLKNLFPAVCLAKTG